MYENLNFFERFWLQNHATSFKTTLRVFPIFYFLQKIVAFMKYNSFFVLKCLIYLELEPKY